MAYFEQDYLVKTLTFRSHTIHSLSFILFIDDFDVHRNMYWVLKAFYWILTCLPYLKWQRVINVFTLSLGPYEAKMEDMIDIFSKSIQKLNWECVMTVNEEEVIICAFIMILTGNMSQQVNSEGFLQHSACMNCHTCFCFKKSHGDLYFDVFRNEWYHWQTVDLHRKADDLSGTRQIKFLQQNDLKLKESSIAKLAPSLDLIQSHAYNASHSEWQNLEWILQDLLFSAILSKHRQSDYLKVFQTFQYSSDWARIQSLMYYIWFWSLSKAEHASILTSLILHSCGKIEWFQMRYLQAAEKHLAEEEDSLLSTLTSMQLIIYTFVVITQCNTVVGSQQYTYPDLIHLWVLWECMTYQHLIMCAIDADRDHHDADYI